MNKNVENILGKPPSPKPLTKLGSKVVVKHRSDILLDEHVSLYYINLYVNYYFILLVL